MSGNHLNDLSKVYLDKIAKINATTAIEDKSRWQDLGGPTPGNYNPTDDSAKIKEDYETQKKKEVLTALKKRDLKKSTKEKIAADIVKRKGDTSKSDDRYAYESFSNWRDDLREIVDEPESKAEKKVSEKKGISNKIVINPKLDEAIKEIGGELLEIAEVDKETDDSKQKEIASKQKRASMIKKQVLMKKLQAVRAGSEDIVASYEPEIDAAVEYFYEEGLNEDGIDLLIEEIGLEEFVEFVTEDEFLTEERKARKMNVRTLKATKKKAEEIKASKKDVVARGTPKDTLARARTERSLKKPKLAKPAKKDHDGDGKIETPKAEHRGSRNKAITKAVTKAKATQPKKPASKEGIGSKIRGALRSAKARDLKGVRKVRDTVRKVQKSEFGKGVVSGVKAVGKAAKDVKGVLDANKKKTVNMQSYEPEGEMIAEKDLSAAERRALPDKDFVFPGKGEGPEGKQRGAYPINDKKHARAALAMAAAHASPAKQAKVRAAVKKKFPDIEVSEGKLTSIKATTYGMPSKERKELIDKERERLGVKPKPTVKEADDKAYRNVVSMLQQKYGKDAVLTKDSPKPKPQPKAKPKPDTRTAAQKKADQHTANMDAVYGGKQRDRGLGT